MKYLLLFPLFALAKPLPFSPPGKLLSLREATHLIDCRPFPVSNTGPSPNEFGFKSVTVEVGREKFVRTDTSDPDGTLTLSRGTKKVCELEISLLQGIRTVPGRVMILHFASGGSSEWRLYETHRGCKLLGYVKDFEKLKDAMDQSLELCRGP